MDVLDALKWRYAVKKFDDKKKLTEQQLEKVLESISLTATSMGMQLMNFIVTENLEIRKKIQPIAYNQPQVTQASHLIIMCRKTKVEQKDISEIVNITSDLRGIELENLTGYQEMLESSLKMPPAQQIAWMENQVYLAMGNLLTVCAVEQIDACPMEGFDRAKLDQLLDLDSMGLKSVLMCPIGYRAADDKYNGLAKIRRPYDKLIHKI